MSVHAHGVTVIKQGRTIVNDVSMHARSGEVTGLIGPNGAGKSTLLAALSGDIAVAAGRVDAAGRWRGVFFPCQGCRRNGTSPLGNQRQGS